MATGTAVTIRENTYQFRGIFEYVWVVRFTLDTPSVSGNSSNEDTVSVPGLRRATDVIIGFTHTVEPSTDISHEVHVGADDTLHILSHNSSGAPIDPASTNYVVVIGRVAPGA